MVAYATLFFAGSRGLWRSRRYWTRLRSPRWLFDRSSSRRPSRPTCSSRTRPASAARWTMRRRIRRIWRSYLASAAHAHNWMLAAHQGLEPRGPVPGLPGARILGTLGHSRDGSRCRRPQQRRRRRRPRNARALRQPRAARVLGVARPARRALHPALQVVPVFSLLRAPGRTGIIVMLVLAVFAAFGVRALRRAGPGRASRWSRPICCARRAPRRSPAMPIDWRDARPISARLRRARAACRAAPSPSSRSTSGGSISHLHTIYMLNSTRHWQPLAQRLQRLHPAGLPRRWP